MKNAKKPIVIYHNNCPDGFGAAYAFWKKYGHSVEYLALSHSSEPFKGLKKKIFLNRKIYMVDISLEREDSIKVAGWAKDFVILDHHISAQKDLLGLSFAKFDMSHSGAALAWMHCHEEELPKILQYIEDRDLKGPNNCHLPYARELLTAIDSYPKDFEIWDKLSEQIETPEGFSKLILEGSAILRYNKVLIESLMENTYRGTIRGYEVPIVNTPFFRSEMLGDLAVGQHFAAGYHYNGKSYVFSLRSTDEGVDVSEVAKSFPGGGGHKKAAGFSVNNLNKIK